MAEITFEQFKNEVLDNIKDYLSEEYEDYKYEIQTVQKAGEAYEALLITPKEKHVGATVTPALNLTRAYSIYANGKPLDKVIAELAKIRMTAVLQLPFNKDDLTKFDKIKDKILPRLHPVNKEYLSDKPYKEVADLVIVYAVRMSENRESFADAVITNNLLETYGITAEELHEIAMANLATKETIFFSIEEAVLGRMENLDIEQINFEDYLAPLFILSNKYTTLGAVEAINPVIMDRIYKKFGKVYIIPISIDEVIVTPQDAIRDHKELRDMLCGINDKDMKPSELLSDNVYEYDIDTHTIRVVA